MVQPWRSKMTPSSTGSRVMGEKGNKSPKEERISRMRRVSRTTNSDMTTLQSQARGGGVEGMLAKGVEDKLTQGGTGRRRLYRVWYGLLSPGLRGEGNGAENKRVCMYSELCLLICGRRGEEGEISNGPPRRCREAAFSLPLIVTDDIGKGVGLAATGRG
ncbi:hypothetical protein BT67DRAFT_13225 [Trichocladium antarcticum]|uniref:Uncharacterized protein n=1 Tax=Trichocladium antarcticum TaxID=1450529 RepID=A0AAN6UTI3_9PEZI|nr:hypothetical protein BT67DRAFT_13225 [Trichocladium antarcticum]